jgi:hypothetical protein
MAVSDRRSARPTMIPWATGSLIRRDLSVQNRTHNAIRSLVTIRFSTGRPASCDGQICLVTCRIRAASTGGYAGQGAGI